MDMIEEERKQKIRESQRRYKQRNPEYKKKWSSTGIKAQIRHRLGNRCIVCGYTDNLHIHHKIKRTGRLDYRIRDIPNYILLCPNHHTEEHKKLEVEAKKVRIKKLFDQSKKEPNPFLVD